MAGRRNAANKRPSMFEVAKMAGVSHQTVSRVINHSPDVSDATREKVQRAIDELGYRPSNSAARLRRIVPAPSGSSPVGNGFMDRFPRFRR